jgi:hypothetical protein
MSDEPRKDQEDEVEGHNFPRPAFDEPAEDGEDNEVEAHKTRPKTRPKYRP